MTRVLINCFFYKFFMDLEELKKFTINGESIRINDILDNYFLQ